MNRCASSKAIAREERCGLDPLAEQVSEAFVLSIERLGKAALELQVDLEMCRYEQAKTTDYSNDPYDEFIHFAALVCFDTCIHDDSSHAGLTHSQIYLACAWNYIDIARSLGKSPVNESGWTLHEITESAQKFERAARKLLEDAVTAPNSCLPCGTPKVELPRWRH